jgi:hypothetical protein
MALHPPHEKEQISAIEIQLATAPDIQDDLRNYISRITEPYDKVGLDDSIFDFAELVGYRINNSCKDIAEDLDLEERYNLINDQPRSSVSMAFRGHHNKEFMPDYQFEGLFSKELNDMIEGIRYELNGRENGHIGGLIGGRNRMELLSDTERIELSRSGGLKSRGRGYWQTHPELLEEICDLRNEGLSWNDTTDEFNRRHGTEYNSKSLSMSYQRNKHLLSDEEE